MQSGMEVPSTMLSVHWNWQKLFSYGEVFCFVSAWAVGLLIAMQEHAPDQDHGVTRSYAAAADELGAQARLTR
jgi:hypothetical protein